MQRRDFCGAKGQRLFYRGNLAGVQENALPIVPYACIVYSCCLTSKSVLGRARHFSFFIEKCWAALLQPHARFRPAPWP